MHASLRGFSATLVSSLLVGVCVIGHAPSVEAHAVLMSATPAAKSVVSGPDVSVALRFNSRIDGKRSRLWVVLPDRSVRVLQLAPQEAPEALSSGASGLTSGDYRIRWQVLASDGHITRGEFAFRVSR